MQGLSTTKSVQQSLYTDNRVAEGHEFVNMAVAYFKQLINLIVQRYDVKFSPDDSVNANMGNYTRLFTLKSCTIFLWQLKQFRESTGTLWYFKAHCFVHFELPLHAIMNVCGQMLSIKPTICSPSLGQVGFNFCDP